MHRRKRGAINVVAILIIVALVLAIIIMLNVLGVIHIGGAAK